MKSFTLLGLDPGKGIGVALLTENGLHTYETDNLFSLLAISYDYVAFEDFSPYRGMKLTYDMINLIKQVGKLEYLFPQRVQLWRPTVCKVITGSSSATKKEVNRVLKGLDTTLVGKSQHEMDAAAIALTLGAILELRGGIVPKTCIWRETCHALIVSNKLKRDYSLIV